MDYYQERGLKVIKTRIQPKMKELFDFEKNNFIHPAFTSFFSRHYQHLYQFKDLTIFDIHIKNQLTEHDVVVNQYCDVSNNLYNDYIKEFIKFWMWERNRLRKTYYNEIIEQCNNRPNDETLQGYKQWICKIFLVLEENDKRFCYGNDKLYYEIINQPTMLEPLLKPDLYNHQHQF